MNHDSRSQTDGASSKRVRRSSHASSYPRDGSQRSARRCCGWSTSASASARRGDRGRLVRGQARRDRRNHRPQRRGKIDAHPLLERAREARQRAHRGARRGHRAARRARLAQGPPARWHDLPALQPAVVQDCRRQCRASAQDRGAVADERRDRVRSLLWLVGLEDKATLSRASSRAGKSSASASPARSRPTPRSSCPTKRPPRLIPRRRLHSRATARHQPQARPHHRSHHPRDERGAGDRRPGHRARSWAHRRRGRGGAPSSPIRSRVDPSPSRARPPRPPRLQGPNGSQVSARIGRPGSTPSFASSSKASWPSVPCSPISPRRRARVPSS